MAWEDLSDSELRTRLFQHEAGLGMVPDDQAAEKLVRYRDDPEIARLIEEILGD